MKVQIINKSPNPLPSYATPGSAGLDLRANLKDTSSYILRPGDSVLIPTGVHVKLPQGYEAQIRPRSGLALKHSITVLNTPGTIDADYIDEIGVILINHGTLRFVIENGDRIAQMIISKYERISWEEVESLDETERKGGFGHTGIK